MNAWIVCENEKLRVRAFGEGLEVHGWEVRYMKPLKCPTGVPPDLIVIGSMRVDTLPLRVWAEAAGVPWVLVEMGWFLRCNGPHDPVGYNQTGIGRIGWMPAGPVPRDRWERLGMGIEKLKSGNAEKLKRVLVLGQVPNDGQHGLNVEEMTERLRWLLNGALAFEPAGCLPEIVWRPHPLGKFTPKGFRFVRVDDGPLEVSLAAADVVVTINSTAGLEALRMGKRVVCDRMAFYWPVACGLVEREDFFVRLAYGQWTAPELQSGEAWGFLKTELKREMLKS